MWQWYIFLGILNHVLLSFHKHWTSAHKQALSLKSSGAGPACPGPQTYSHESAEVIQAAAHMAHPGCTGAHTWGEHGTSALYPACLDLGKRRVDIPKGHWGLSNSLGLSFLLFSQPSCCLWVLCKLSRKDDSITIWLQKSPAFCFLAALRFAWVRAARKEKKVFVAKSLNRTEKGYNTGNISGQG